MTTFRRVLAMALTCAALVAGASHAQQNPLREVPKDAKAGYLNHIAENAFSLDGRRILLAPGGIIRGTNNMILTPNMVPRDALVSYKLDADGQIARAWVLTRDEAAKANVGMRFPWQTSPETGTSVSAILGSQNAQPGIAQPGQRGQAPGFMQQQPAPEQPQPITGNSQ